MTDTTAQIRAKKTGNTGLTEELAKKFADAEHGHLMAIVELKVVTVHKDVDSGDRQVDFVITDLEPVDAMAEDHVRGLQRAHFMNRKLHSEDGQLAIDTRDDLEPTVEQVLAAGTSHIPHPYMDTADALCEVCQQPAGAALHQELTDDEEPVEESVDEPDEKPEPDPAAATEPDPWEYEKPEGAKESTVLDPFAKSTSGAT